MMSHPSKEKSNSSGFWDRRCWYHAIVNSLVSSGVALLGYSLNHDYDWGLFILTPLLTGFVIAFTSRGKKLFSIVAATSVFISVLFLLFSGFESILCIVLAWPILFSSLGLGALLGYLIGKKFIHRYGNLAVVAMCLSMLSLVGWTNGSGSGPRPLEVRTSMQFYAPMPEVWDVIKESGDMDGRDGFLKFIGLPVPKSCSLLPDQKRVCYFEEGQILQKITDERYGERIEFKIIDHFEVRDWLSFISAGYRFVQHDDHVEVIRNDLISSELQPRWYWHWFEEQCVRLEHRYVMSCMKRRVEKQ